MFIRGKFGANAWNVKKRVKTCISAVNKQCATRDVRVQKGLHGTIPTVFYLLSVPATITEEVTRKGTR